MLDYIVARLREASTWNGIAILIGTMGFQLNPAMLYEIGVGVASVIGLTQVLVNEKR